LPQRPLKPCKIAILSVSAAPGYRRLSSTRRGQQRQRQEDRLWLGQGNRPETLRSQGQGNRCLTVAGQGTDPRQHRDDEKRRIQGSRLFGEFAEEWRQTYESLRPKHNPADWDSRLKPIMPKQRKRGTVRGGRKAMDYHDLPAFMQKLATNSDKSSPALELAILTFARTIEVQNTRWSQPDLERPTSAAKL
jgi:integrase